VATSLIEEEEAKKIGIGERMKMKTNRRRYFMVVILKY
jgi:hypothetical protein